MLAGGGENEENEPGLARFALWQKTVRCHWWDPKWGDTVKQIKISWKKH